MGLVNMRTLLARAEQGSYAVGSFSVANMECIEGVIAAAEACRAPVILQIAEARLPYSPLYLIGPMMMAAAEHARVPVAVHLDHGKTLGCIQEALDLGFTSVMCDGSDLPIGENVSLTRQVVAMASRTGAAVEAEVGRVGKNEDGTAAKEQIATLDDCLQMDATGIDALAVGIGNAHGLYAQTPHLRYEVVEEAHGRLHAALVLHGGSGLTDEQFRTLVRLGMRKLNVATDIFRAQAGACEGKDIFRNIGASSKAVAEVVSRYIRLFGSEGKADV
ncbi:MAG: ketose-bisphosphate aldolase [Clostridiales bacterium]|nr:ketose-bisphosphate aldolase [Clostridiales bacterium]